MPALLSILAQSSSTDSPGLSTGLVIIIVTLVVAVVVIGGVWTFVARRGSRVPRRDPHDRDHVGR